MNPLHRLAIGGEQQDGAVVDDDLHVALVVLDEEMVVLDRVARVRIAVGAGDIEEVVIEECEHVRGHGSDGDDQLSPLDATWPR